MPVVIEISDPAAPELAPFAKLTEAQLRARQSPQEGRFIAESPNVIARALDAGVRPIAFLMERRQIAGAAAPLLARCPDTPVYTADREVLAGLTGFALTRGILCAMHRPAPQDPAALCENARRLAVLQGVTDPSNVGAIFRSAAGLGMDAVLLAPDCCDPLYRRAARVSMGAVFQIPWARLGRTAADWPAALSLLHQQGFLTAALALTENALPVTEPSLATAPRLALLLGSEGNGLPPDTIAACGCAVRIPMAHGLDSLNVAAAAAVAFWQLRGQ